MEHITPNVFEFLRDQVYLPGYMTLMEGEYDANGAAFLFDVKEPPVARGSILDYMTPRGLHICISQAQYALVEQLSREGELKVWDVDSLRRALLGKRVKIWELNERFPGEILLDELVPGRIDIRSLRVRTKPTLEIGFNLGEGRIKGTCFSTIAPVPHRQTNQDISRLEI